MSDMHLGTVLKEKREARGLSVWELSRRSRLPQTLLGDTENGRVYPSPEELYRLASVLEVEPDEILDAAFRLTTAEYRLLDAWRTGNTAALLQMIAARISEVHDE